MDDPAGQPEQEVVSFIFSQGFHLWKFFLTTIAGWLIRDKYYHFYSE